MITDENSARSWLREALHCDDGMMERLSLFASLLAEENECQNLVSAASVRNIWQRHIADSAQLVRHVPRGTSPWLDLGTGAGFPGLVAAVLGPDTDFVLVESRRRRVDWLNRATKALDLRRVTVIGSRLESISAMPMCVISARAFAPLDRLLAQTSQFSTADTIWLLPKGRSAKQELDELRGWNHAFHVEQSITDPEAGVIIGTLLGRSGQARREVK